MHCSRTILLSRDTPVVFLFFLDDPKASNTKLLWYFNHFDKNFCFKRWICSGFVFILHERYVLSLPLYYTFSVWTFIQLFLFGILFTFPCILLDYIPFYFISFFDFLSICIYFFPFIRFNFGYSVVSIKQAALFLSKQLNVQDLISASRVENFL